MVRSAIIRETILMCDMSIAVESILMKEHNERLGLFLVIVMALAWYLIPFLCGDR
jgi:hypothetical protein